MTTLANFVTGIGSSIIQQGLKVLNFFVDLIAGAIGGIINSHNIPGLDTFFGVIENFIDFIFGWVNYIRSVFLIDSFCINIIILILTMKFIIRPAITGIKMLLKWWHTVK